MIPSAPFLQHSRPTDQLRSGTPSLPSRQYWRFRVGHQLEDPERGSRLDEDPLAEAEIRAGCPAGGFTEIPGQDKFAGGAGWVLHRIGRHRKSMRGMAGDEGPAAHGPRMSKEQPKTSASFFATGHLTGGEIWVAPDLPTLIADLIGDPEYLSRSPAGRLTARERFACSLATETQAGLIQAAVREETWSWVGASSCELSRLIRAREVTDRDGPWKGTVPLILVRPADPAWKAPTGRVKVITPATDSGLLWGALQLGWLTGAGRLDSSGGIGDLRWRR
jgi:hypothetical protein